MGRRCGCFRDLFDGEELGQLGVLKGAAALVAHGGLDAGVAEQLLNFTQVGCAGEQRSGLVLGDDAREGVGAFGATGAFHERSGLRLKSMS